MHASKSVIAFCACAFLAFSSAPAAALSCVPPQADQKTIDASAAIFEGVVVEEMKPSAEVAPGAEEALEKGAVYTFQVTRGWKGVAKGDQVEVVRNIYWGDGFQMGKAYLVFATGDAQGRMSAPLCGPTGLLDQTGEFQQALLAHFGPQEADPPVHPSNMATQ